MTFVKLALFVGLALSLALTAYTYAASRWLERLYPPLGSFVEIAGQRLQYLSQGEGQSIVLLHGANASLQDFKASLFDPLAKDYRVIAFDRPGYGYSTRSFEQWPDPEVQADIIHQALAKLGVENPVLVGHSWAGSVVMAYLLKYPDAVAGGVLLAGATHPWEGGVSSNVQLAGVAVLGKLFTSTLVMPVGQMVFDTAVEAVFAPEQRFRRVPRMCAISAAFWKGRAGVTAKSKNHCCWSLPKMTPSFRPGTTPSGWCSRCLRQNWSNFPEPAMRCTTPARTKLCN